jgi:hypothetical protein
MTTDNNLPALLARFNMLAKSSFGDIETSNEMQMLKALSASIALNKKLVEAFKDVRKSEARGVDMKWIDEILELAKQHGVE